VQPSPSPPPAQPIVQEAPPPSPPPAPTGHDVYGATEAIADAFSGPWTFVGTGEWFGLFSINACVYKNERVLIVNHYCTSKEMSSAGVIVLSPTRGRVYLYAEGKTPISTSRRDAWATFKAEGNLPTNDPPLRLDFTWGELRAWDEARYYMNAPGCFGGVENHKPQAGCYRLDAAVEDWGARNKDFLAEPSEDWYRLVRELRTVAKRDARPFVAKPRPKQPDPPPPDPVDRGGKSRPDEYTPPSQRKK
jgi:hypothetical protein